MLSKLKRKLRMDSIEKILANLKEGEFTFIITVLINALQLYLVCFYFIEEFKDLQWYQEILIPLSISLSYTFLFVGLFFLFGSICLILGKKYFEIISHAMESHLVFYYSIFPLSASFITQLYKFIHIEDFSFSLEEYFNFAFCIGTGVVSSPILTPLFILIIKIIRLPFNWIKKLYNMLT